MPNSEHSSPTPRPQNRTPGRQPQSHLSDAQSAIQGATAELRRLDHRLGEISDSLPQANGEFDILAELRGAVDVVRTDLLTDAISTLDAAAVARESDLRFLFTERQGFLVAVEE